MLQRESGLAGPDTEAKYEALLTAAVDAVVVIDTHGIISEFSPAATKLFGYDRAEAVGQNVRLLMPEPYHGEHDHFIRRYLDTAVARIIGIGREVTGLRKNGESFPMDLAVGEIRHQGLSGFVGLIRDLSARKAVDERLRKSEAELSLTIGQAPMAIATSNLQGRFLNVNQALCDLVGYSANELNGMGFQELTHPEDLAMTHNKLQCLACGDLDRYRIATRWLSKSGHVLNVELYNGLVRDGEARPDFMVAEIVDRTAELEAAKVASEHRERLLQVGRLGTLGEVAAGIAHEINQPLAAMANYAKAARRILDANDGDRAVVLDALSKISVQAERAGDIIEQFRALLKHQLPQMTSVDCNSMIEQIQTLAELDVHRHNLRLDLQLAQHLPSVKGDAVQLQQVLLNLVHNGIDAMKTTRSSDAVVVSTVSHGQDWVAIHVDDAGAGISDELEENLFEPFVTSKTEGLGLGLSICKSIVDAHGGELSYERRPSGGTRFTLVLPVAQ